MVSINWQELHRKFMDSKLSKATEFVADLNMKLNYDECWLIQKWEEEKKKEKNEFKLHNSIGILDSLLGKLGGFSQVNDLQGIKEYADVLCKVINLKQKVSESKSNKSDSETAIFLINDLSGPKV